MILELASQCLIEQILKHSLESSDSYDFELVVEEQDKETRFDQALQKPPGNDPAMLGCIAILLTEDQPPETKTHVYIYIYMYNI